MFGLVAAVCALSAQTAMAGMFSGDDISKEQLGTVKVSMESAIAKAKKAQPGIPTQVKMEREDDTIKYEVKILNGDEEKEVNVNAITGEIEIEK